MDSYVKVLALRIANQLGRSVDNNLAQKVLKLCEYHRNEADFIDACRQIAQFDLDFLHKLYNEQRDTSNALKPAPSPAPEPPVVRKKEPCEPKKLQVGGENEEEEDDLGPEVKIKHGTGLSTKAQEKLAEIRRKREERAAVDTVKRGPDPGTTSPQHKRPKFKSRPKKPINNEPEPELEIEEEEADYDAEVRDALDRGWYATDEFGHAAGDDMHNPFYDSWSYDPRDDEVMEERMNKKLSARARERQKQQDLWERNRMQSSGMAQQDAAEMEGDEDEEEENRVHLFVHDLKPPFLDGQQVYTRQKAPVSAVRDSESNMAVYSKRGSTVVKERRMMKERAKYARSAVSTAGTALGNILGVKHEEEPEKSAQTSEEAVDSEKPKLSMTEQRQQLPAFAVRDELLKVIRENQVVVVIGETGSGKTTQLTQFLYEAGYGERGLIGCTQPRRVAAMSVAKRVGEEMGVKLGQEVGYVIRFEDETSPNTKIKYLTDGILLREALMSDNLERYSCIIMDEAHERALNTDILLGLFKEILTNRRDLKLIVTSATMNAQRFSQFYGGAPQFTIPGRTFPVDVFHADTTPVDYVDAAVRQVLQIHVSQPVPGDILVFMTGQEDIETTCDLITERLSLLVDKPNNELLVLPIYSQMPADLQNRIFDPPPKNTRKVIVATNVAETSLTVDGILYVVDTGYAKVKVFNPRLNMDALQVMPISQANANQRSGRAGRTAHGSAYRLYTERAEHEEMHLQTIPEIQRSNLANTILTLKNLGIKDLLQFDFVDPPPSDTMNASLYDLWALGALSNVGQLTKQGALMSAFPTEPSLSKLLVKSAEYQCSIEMVTIVAMLSVSAVFYRPKGFSEEADSAREKFFVPESDHLTLLNVYNQWTSNKCSESWCTRHYLFGRQLRRAKEIRDQLTQIFAKEKLALRSCNGDWDMIRKCVCSGYFHQAARRKGSDGYINLRTGVVSKLHHTSALTNNGFLPEYVVYHELVLTSTQYLSNVTAVDPRWLAQLGGVFYSIKEKGYDSTTKRVQEIEHNERMRLEADIERDRVQYERDQKSKADKDQKSKKHKKSAVVLPGARLRTKKRGM